MGFTVTGVKQGEIYVGGISTRCRSGKTTVDVKVDTFSNVSTKVTYDVVAVAGAKAAVSFSIPDHKSGKLDVHYLHRHAAINSSIGLNPSPLLEVSACIGSKRIAIGGEIIFDTSSSSFTECNAGICYNQQDFSAAILLKDKGRTANVSYALVNPLTGTEVAAEMIHSLCSFHNSFILESVHKIGPRTLVKTRFSGDGKVAVSSHWKWWVKTIITFSAEYDTKAMNAAPMFSLSLARKP